MEGNKAPKGMRKPDTNLDISLSIFANVSVNFITYFYFTFSTANIKSKLYNQANFMGIAWLSSLMALSRKFQVLHCLCLCYVVVKVQEMTRLMVRTHAFSTCRDCADGQGCWPKIVPHCLKIFFDRFCPCLLLTTAWFLCKYLCFP